MKRRRAVQIFLAPTPHDAWLEVFASPAAHALQWTQIATQHALLNDKCSSDIRVLLDEMIANYETGWLS